MEFGSDLTGRMQEFLDTAGGLGILLLGLGIVLGLTLALLNKRKWLLALFVIFLTFSGFAVESVDAGSTLLRWGLIFLLALTCFAGMKFPGWPAILLGFVGFIGLFAGLSGPFPLFSAQRSGLLIVFALLMGAAIAWEVASVEDVYTLIKGFNIAAGVFLLLGLATLGSLHSGKRFGGASASVPIFVLTGGLLLPYALYGAMTWRQKGWRIYCIFLTIGVSLLCIISAQRTGTFAGIIGCLPLLLRIQAKKILVSVFVLVLCVAVVGGVFLLLPEQGNFVMERFTSADTTGRTEIWQDGLESCLKEPWLGHGIGSAGMVSHGKGLHSAYLTAWYDVGIGGLILFAAVYLLTAWRALRLILQSYVPEIKDLGRLLLGATLACMAAGMTEESIFSPSNMGAYVGMSSGVLAWRLWVLYRSYRFQEEAFDLSSERPLVIGGY